MTKLHSIATNDHYQKNLAHSPFIARTYEEQRSKTSRGPITHPFHSEKTSFFVKQSSQSPGPSPHRPPLLCVCLKLHRPFRARRRSRQTSRTLSPPMPVLNIQLSRQIAQPTGPGYTNSLVPARFRSVATQVFFRVGVAATPRGKGVLDYALGAHLPSLSVRCWPGATRLCAPFSALCDFETSCLFKIPDLGLRCSRWKLCDCTRCACPADT